MFNFTTTTVVNTNVDLTSGLPRWSAQPADATHPASLDFKRLLKFLEPNTMNIYKRAYSAPLNAKATLDMSLLTDDGNYRIAMYIRSLNMDPTYANDMVFKGIPQYIEFVKKASDTAAMLATSVANQIKKWQIAYNQTLVKATANGALLELDAVTEYQRFEKVDVEFYDTTNTSLYAPSFVIVQSAREATDPEYDGVNTIVQGKEGFGTYEWILYNLRIPTIEQTSWMSQSAQEMPIPGGKYNQYIIYYEVDRGVMGQNAVGQLARSRTTHVLYVLDTLAASFEAALATIGTIEDQTKP